MANQKQSFRFRFPWFGQQNPTPQSPRTRPTQETRIPAQMTAALAGNRPVSRPVRIAPTQPPPSQPPKTEPQNQPASQPPSASRAPEESRATSQPPSPSRAPKETRATSQPSSPPSQLPSSPSRAVSQSRDSSDSPSKSAAISKPQPDPQTASSKPQSPSHLASQSVRGTTSPQATSPESPANKGGLQSASLSSQRGEKVAESQPPLQEPEKKMETASEKTHVAPNESPMKTTSQADDNGEKGTAQASDSVATPSPSHQQDDKAAVSQPALQESQPKMEVKPEIEKTYNSPLKTTSQADDNGEKGSAQASDSVATPSPSQQEDKAAVAQPALQASQPKMEITPETEKTSKSPLKTTSQDDREATKTAATSPKEVAEPIGSLGQKSDTNNANGGDQKKTVSKVESAEEGKKTAEEFPEEEKTNLSPAYEEPVQKTITEHIPTVTGHRKHTRDPANVAFREEKWPQKQETWDKKNRVATTTYIGKQIKTVSSSGNTFQKPVWSADEQAPQQKAIKEDISKLVHKLTAGHQLAESPVTVITLTGENRGASMNVSSQPAKKEESVHIHRGYKLNPDDSAETTTDGEVSNTQGRRLSREPPPIKAYSNSNVQTINNSLVFNASVKERNPGIHLQFSQDDAEPTGINGRSESHQAHRDEFSITPFEKLTHEHTVKRRCLRGLFLESSDSEPDNPERPRRHGCRYGCLENKKDKELGA